MPHSLCFLYSKLGHLRMTVLPDASTPQESNVILSNAFEYRMPSKEAEKLALERAAAGNGTGRADMVSRFLGLIVIPGRQIAKMEVEERLSAAQSALSIRTKS